LSTPFHLLIPQPIYDAILAQARHELPNECCGLLAGKVTPSVHENFAVGIVRKRYPLVNAAASPTKAYLSDGNSLIQAHRDMRTESLDVLAVYHSHPTTVPVPSRTDLNQNYWPNVVQLIISLKSETPVVEGWWLDETTYREATWRVIED
jgi:[CysO sulfur-carrier protein]-S-L-cysteine hydrolase